MPEEPLPSLSFIITRVALYSLLGIPLAAVIWEQLNKVISGHFPEVRVLFLIPALLLFGLLLRQLASAVETWDSRQPS